MSLISCDNKNTSFGDVKIDDDNSKMIQKLFESVEKEETKDQNQTKGNDKEIKKPFSGKGKGGKGKGKGFKGDGTQSSRIRMTP